MNLYYTTTTSLNVGLVFTEFEEIQMNNIISTYIATINLYYVPYKYVATLSFWVLQLINVNLFQNFNKRPNLYFDSYKFYHLIN